MKLNKLFMFILVVFVMVVCSNDDELGIDKGGQKGELIDVISIVFISFLVFVICVDKGEIEGVGIENNVYVVYFFVKENDFQYEGVKVGDWIVKCVVGDSNIDDKDVVVVIGEGDVVIFGMKKNMCMFNGVCQGDSVYVVVNDFQMIFVIVQILVYQGDKLEVVICVYIFNFFKSYLNDLIVIKDGMQGKKYIMVGVLVIFINLNILNGFIVKVLIFLNCELVKVFFNVFVIINFVYEVYGKMVIKDVVWENLIGIKDFDGIVVVCILRCVFLFMVQVCDWYFLQSVDVIVKDWDVEGWLKVFVGES